MKKLTLIALFAIVGFVANAQKGSILLSGNIGFSTSSVEKSNTSAQLFNFNPQIGYGISDNLHFGVFNETTLAKGADFKGNALGNDNLNGNLVVVGPFLRYTKKFGDIFAVFADAKLGWMSAHHDQYANNGGKSGFHFGITPSALINLTNNFGLTFSFGGVNYQAFGFNEAQSTEFNMNFGKQFSVGVQKVFGK
jgi:hypothetical protein